MWYEVSSVCCALCVHSFVVNIHESCVLFYLTPFLFLTLDPVHPRILPKSCWALAVFLTLVMWPYPICHPAFDICYYFLPLSFWGFFGFCYATSTWFSHPPTVLSSGFSFVWSFAFIFPKALFLAFYPSFCVLLFLQQIIYSLHLSPWFSICVNTPFLSAQRTNKLPWSPLKIHKKEPIMCVSQTILSFYPISFCSETIFF